VCFLALIPAWKPVRTRNFEKLSKIERYDYAQNKELFEANNGMTLAV